MDEVGSLEGTVLAVECRFGEMGRGEHVGLVGSEEGLDTEFVAGGGCGVGGVGHGGCVVWFVFDGR